MTQTYKHILNVMAVPFSGTTLFKTLACENESFLNFPEIKHPILFRYFEQLLNKEAVKPHNIKTILDSFYNTINKQQKDIIVQKFPSEKFREYSFMERIYPENNNYYVFIKRRISDFKSIYETYTSKNERAALQHMKMLYDGYRAIYEDYCRLPDDRKITICYEDMVKDPNGEMNKVFSLLGVDGVEYKDGKYSKRVEWQGERIYIDCKEEERARVNTGELQLERTQKFRYLPRNLLIKYLNSNEIIKFEESLGTNIKEIEKFLDESV